MDGWMDGLSGVPWDYLSNQICAEVYTNIMYTNLQVILILLFLYVAIITIIVFIKCGFIAHFIQYHVKKKTHKK